MQQASPDCDGVGWGGGAGGVDGVGAGRAMFRAAQRAMTLNSGKKKGVGGMWDGGGGGG